MAMKNMKKKGTTSKDQEFLARGKRESFRQALERGQREGTWHGGKHLRGGKENSIGKKTRNARREGESSKSEQTGIRTNVRLSKNEETRKEGERP